MGAEVIVSPTLRFVIPAKAGIHSRCMSDSHDDQRLWIPAFAGMTKVFA